MGMGCKLRDWLHVRDHCSTIKLYYIGKRRRDHNIVKQLEKANIEIVKLIIHL